MKLTGRVTSIKMNQTVVVLVESTKTHPLYKKSYLRTKRYLVDDQIGLKLGDIVEMEKVRPISKNKHWRATKMVGRNMEEIINEEIKEGVAEAIEEVMPEEKEESRVESQESSEEETEVVQEKPTKRRAKKS